MSIKLSTQIISKLNSSNSLIPLATKDIVNSAGNIYYSYNAGGKIEGKDKFVDEIGTSAIWLFGIPTYNKLIDKSIYKIAKISPKVDVRVLKNKKYLKEAIKNAPTEKIKKEIQTVAKNSLKSKNLATIKFSLALTLTMLSYFGLTKFKQNMTKNNIEKEFSKKQKEYIKPIYKTNPIFNEIENNNKTPSFGRVKVVKIAEEAVLNPIKNMIVLDSCISGQRLITARNSNERKEILLKEGSFLFFVYGANEIIKQGIENFSEKIFKLPITLEAKFLDSNLAKNLLRNKKQQKEVKDFIKLIEAGNNKTTIYKFILNNPNNTVIKAAKKSGIIKTIKDEAGNIKIDTRKYIDLKEIEKLTKELNKFIEKSKNNNFDKYLKKIKLLKNASTIINMGICCLTLGFIVPKLIFKLREKSQNGNSEFHVKTEYEKELNKHT